MAWIYARRASRYVDDDRARELAREAELRIDGRRRGARAHARVPLRCAAAVSTSADALVAALGGGPSLLAASQTATRRGRSWSA